MTIFMWNYLGMESFDVNPFMTQDIEFEFVANNMPTKAPREEKTPRCIVGYVHLSCMASSYHPVSCFIVEIAKM
jgi:hypothetical protein